MFVERRLIVRWRSMKNFFHAVRVLTLASVLSIYPQTVRQSTENGSELQEPISQNVGAIGATFACIYFWGLIRVNISGIE